MTGDPGTQFMSFVDNYKSLRKKNRIPMLLEKGVVHIK